MTFKPQLQEPQKRGIAAATLERLEAEKEARIQAKIDAGKAVRGPPIVVGIANPKKDYAAVYRDAAGRDVYPDRLVVTGVPRSGRDDGLEVPTSSPHALAYGGGNEA